MRKAPWSLETKKPCVPSLKFSNNWFSCSCWEGRFLNFVIISGPFANFLLFYFLFCKELLVDTGLHSLWVLACIIAFSLEFVKIASVYCKFSVLCLRLTSVSIWTKKDFHAAIVEMICAIFLQCRGSLDISFSIACVWLGFVIFYCLVEIWKCKCQVQCQDTSSITGILCNLFRTGLVLCSFAFCLTYLSKFR